MGRCNNRSRTRHNWSDNRSSFQRSYNND
jgi:conserved repeat domain